MAEPVRCHLTDELEPDITHLQIEDGEPVDNIFSEKQQLLLIESLDASLREELLPCVALANIGLFASPDQALRGGILERPGGQKSWRD